MKGTISLIVAVAVLAATSAAAQTTPKPAAPGTTAPATSAPKPAGATTAPKTTHGGTARARQVLTPSPVVFAHLHMHVKDLAASRKFWIEGLGGTAVSGVAAGEAVRFPTFLVFLEQTAPKGGSKGSVVDHVTFGVKDVKAALATAKKAGAQVVTRAETNPVYVVTDDVAFMPDRGTSSAVVMGPDEMKVELIEVKQQTTPIAFQDIHFTPAVVTPMKDWYMQALGAKLGNRGFGYESLDLGSKPSALMFTLASDAVAPTAGRVDDRIGFEVRGLALLGKKLEKLGAKVTRPYGKSPSGIGMSEVITDPFGTSIELTEGLTKLQ
jgi:predicted enzyme related to lactoylglutathione lyase